jgi:transposase
MLMIGCDFHMRFQQIVMMDPLTGEIVERRLDHEAEEARKFYEALPKPARVGIEATGHAHWFEGMLEEQGHEGSAARAESFDRGKA